MKAMMRFSLVSLPLALTAVGLAACASLFGGNDVKVRPIDSMSSLMTTPRDTFYESAVSAINEKDYARALDYLQEARARDPRNVKALNALGVVYDKLGRFDLSARYYAQARTLDPNSQIVAANIGYSQVLQGLKGVDQHSAVASLETSGVTPLSTEKSLKAASSLEAGTVHVAAEKQPTITAKSPVVAIAPPTPPVQSPVFAISIPAEVVAPIRLVADNKIAVLPITSAPIVPAAVGLSAPSVLAKPATEVRMVATPVQPAVIAPVVPVAERQVAVLPVLPAAIAPVIIHPAEKQAIVLPSPALLAKPALERRVAAASTLANAARVVPVAERQIATAPIPSTSTVRIDRPVKKRETAPSAPALVKAATTVREARIAIPPAFRAATVHAVHAKVAETLPGNRKVLTIGRPVKILNASGRRGGTEFVSHRLAALGWCVRQSDWRNQAMTTLYYPAQNIVAAKAMQRTLPFPTRLTPDNSSTSTMRLVIGRDYLSWKPRNARLAALWQNRRVVASLPKPSTRGAR